MEDSLLELLLERRATRKRSFFPNSSQTKAWRFSIRACKSVTSPLEAMSASCIIRPPFLRFGFRDDLFLHVAPRPFGRATTSGEPSHEPERREDVLRMILLGEEGKDSSGLGGEYPFGLWNSTD